MEREMKHGEVSRLHKLAARGQSIWIDTLSRHLIELGRAEEDDDGRRRHRRHVEPVDLPEGARGGRRLRRAAEGAARQDRRRDGDLLHARARGHPGRVRRAAARVRRDRRRRRLRLDGGRAGDRLRHREDVRPGALDREGGRPPEPVREDPGDDGRAARDRGLHRARHVDQRHADLLARALQGGRRGVPARARAARRGRRRPVEGALGRVVLRLARRHRGRQAPRRRSATPTLQGKLAIANAKLAYEHFLEAFSGPRWEFLEGKGATQAAVPVGLDVDEEPGLPRRDLRRGADRARHGEHDAARDDRGVPGSRRGARRHGARRPRRGASSCSTSSATSASTTTTSSRRSRRKASRSSPTRSTQLIDSIRAKRGSLAAA